MSRSNSCFKCKSKSLVRDDVTGQLVCESCGVLQEFDGFEANFGDFNGPQGTFVRIGTSGTGGVLNYKEKKVYEAEKLIDDIAYRLGLSGPKGNDVKAMIADITEGEFGQGNWFTVLIGACAYVVMRRDNRPLPIAEVSPAIGCNEQDLGRMVSRVVEFLDLKRTQQFPEFDIVGSFERALRNAPSFDGVDEDDKERMRKQGIFLMQCAVKWFLTTGRKPLPMVAAVLVFVAELNGVRVKIDKVAKEVHAVVHTTKLRYNELLDLLVKVAGKVLPWGGDVTRKNLTKNAPFVIQYMEKKAMSKTGCKKRGRRMNDLEDVVSECLRKDIDYEMDRDNMVDDDSRYFELVDESMFVAQIDDAEELKLSSECLSMIYTKFLNEVGRARSGERGSGGAHRRKRKDFDLHDCTEWWNGKSELSKKLLLKQILEKDVGLETMPPSFVNGCKVYERRRERIRAAKRRIDRIMLPSNADSGDATEDVQPPGKKRKAKGVDWEDLIIEMLLLHKVKEEEIEKGYYNTLLDLHVFNSGIF